MANFVFWMAQHTLLGQRSLEDVVQIVCQQLRALGHVAMWDPRNEQFVLHISRLKVDPGLKAVVRAGGELLEKYNVPRHGFAIDHFLHAREKGPYGPKPRPRLILPEFETSARR